MIYRPALCLRCDAAVFGPCSPQIEHRLYCAECIEEVFRVPYRTAMARVILSDERPQWLGGYQENALRVLDRLPAAEGI